MDITKSEFLVFGYINGFRFNKDTWFCQASLIVDKRKDNKENPFVFQNVSLPVFGIARRLLDAYSSEEGAIRGFGADVKSGRRAFRFRIMGYRVVKSNNPEYPFDIKGRILSIDDQDD